MNRVKNLPQRIRYARTGKMLEKRAGTDRKQPWATKCAETKEKGASIYFDKNIISFFDEKSKNFQYILNKIVKNKQFFWAKRKKSKKGKTGSSKIE